jgi:hypothetical protein
MKGMETPLEKWEREARLRGFEPVINDKTHEIAQAPTFNTVGYRVDIPNWGIPHGATAADVVRFEQDELGNDLGVSPKLLTELENYTHSDVVWVTKEKLDAVDYLSEGQTAEKDISVIHDVKGGKIVATDGQGGYLVLLPQTFTKMEAKKRHLALPTKAAYGEAPTGPYATLLRDVYDILKRTPSPETRLGPGVEVARTEAIDKVITAYESKVITKNELVSLLEEISPERFGRMTYGELNDFLLYWRGRFKPGATAVRTAKPMTEDEFNKFFEAEAVK